MKSHEIYNPQTLEEITANWNEHNIVYVETECSIDTKVSRFQIIASQKGKIIKLNQGPMSKQLSQNDYFDFFVEHEEFKSMYHEKDTT